MAGRPRRDFRTDWLAVVAAHSTVIVPFLADDGPGNLTKTASGSPPLVVATGTLPADTPVPLLDFSQQIKASGLYYLLLESDHAAAQLKLLRQ